MLVFVDESGLPHVNDPNPCSTLAGIALEERLSKDFAREIFNLKKKFWGVTGPTEKELKGRLLLNKRSFTSPKKIEFVEELFTLCRQYELQTFATIQERPTQEVLIKDSTYLTTEFTYLLERINKFMEENFPDNFALIVFDGKDDRSNEKTAGKFTNFLYRSTWGKEFIHILPTPFFVNSKITPEIQIADIFAYCINQRFQNRREIEPYYKMIQGLQFISLDGETRGIRYPKPKREG